MHYIVIDLEWNQPLSHQSSAFRRVGDRLIARGELQELDGEQAGQLAVRLIEVAAFKCGM